MKKTIAATQPSVFLEDRPVITHTQKLVWNALKMSSGRIVFLARIMQNINYSRLYDYLNLFLFLHDRRHVCTHEETITRPIRVVESYCKPAYKSFTQRCSNGTMCTAFRYVTSDLLDRKSLFILTSQLDWRASLFFSFLNCRVTVKTCLTFCEIILLTTGCSTTRSTERWSSTRPPRRRNTPAVPDGPTRRNTPTDVCKVSISFF
jgi:hypothetical protein